MGEYVPHLVPGLKPREDIKPLDISQPDGVSFALDGNQVAWQKWTLRVGFNHREGMVLHTVAYDGRPVAHRLSFAEMVVPYRDPTTDHYRRTGVRRRRVGARLHDRLAGAGLRLPRRDPLPRRGHARHEGRAVHDPQRDLHPRGGRRGALEARRRPGRRRGATFAAARALVPRDGRQLRVPRLLAPVPGRQRRVRGPRHRDHGHHALRGGPPAAVRHAGRRAHVRTVPPALPRRPARPRRRRRGQHGVRDRVRGAARRAREPARPRARAAQHAAAHRGGGPAGLRLEHAAGVEGRQRELEERPRDPGRLQARARRRVPADAGPRLAGAAPRAGDRPHAVGHAVPRGRALAVRRVRRAERGGPRPAGLDRREPLDRGHGRRALVRVRYPSHHPPRGVAGDGGGHRVLLAEARGLLRPKPCARRAAVSPSLFGGEPMHRDHQLHPRQARRRGRRRDERADRPQHRRGLRHRAALARGRRRRGVPGLGARLRELA